MSSATANRLSELTYRVESVRPTQAPDGITDGTWFRYVIVGGTTQITGTKLGTLREVTEHAQTEADRCNERFANGGSTYATRRKK